jgi:hypothetical protein
VLPQQGRGPLERERVRQRLGPERRGENDGDEERKNAPPSETGAHREKSTVRKVMTMPIMGRTLDVEGPREDLSAR